MVLVSTTHRDKLEALLHAFAGARDAKVQKHVQDQIKQIVLLEGIPVSKDHSLRARVWKCLLNVGQISADRYRGLVRRGLHADYSEKILNDTFRTFAKDDRFTSAVSEKQIFRLLNAFVNAHAEDKSAGHSFSYVQGMNVLCAPFLYVMDSELEAFYCFEQLITKVMPAYVSKNLDGVRVGCQLLEECLQNVDFELYRHLVDADIRPNVYAFAPILTLGACAPPLDSLLPVWDIYLAGGFHLNILFQAAQVLLMRDEVLGIDQDSANRRTILTGREYPPLDARVLASVAMPLLFRLEDEYYNRLVAHMKVPSREIRKGQFSKTT